VTLFALALVLAAAFIHATWNLLAKSVGGGASFVWLNSFLSTLLYAPFAAGVIFFQRPHLGAVELLFMFGSGLLHLGYFLLLQRGYAVGDLSLVYPLARGTGPLLATAAAIALFGERPSILALCGVLLIGSGVFSLAWEPGARPAGGYLGSGVAYGILTGVFIAAYTLWDKHAVGVLLVPPLLQNWSADFVRALLLSPVAMGRREKVLEIWASHKAAVLGVAVLTPLSYILVLTALSFTPVSYVAPAREVSILIGTAMGARLLAEGNAPRRLFAAAVMVLGVVALVLG
jgi:drug/metabolite transporter (DMT)-like permease